MKAICGTAVADEEIVWNPCVLFGAGVESSPERPTIDIGQVFALADAVGERWRAMVLPCGVSACWAAED